MKKLTKKQHRAIIKDLIEKCDEVRSLRAVQQVAEIFQEEADHCEAGVLTSADTIRLSLDIINEGRASDAYSALYTVWEDAEPDTIDDIVAILETLSERKRHLVFTFVRAYAGK